MSRPVTKHRGAAVYRGLKDSFHSLSAAATQIIAELVTEFDALETSGQRRAEIFERLVMVRAALGEKEAQAAWLDELGTLLIGTPSLRPTQKQRPH